MGVSDRCSCGVGMGVHQIGCVLLSVGPVANPRFDTGAIFEAPVTQSLIEQIVRQTNEYVERAGSDEVVRLLRARGWLVVSPEHAGDLRALGAAAGAFVAVFNDESASDEQERGAAWQLLDAVRAYMESIEKEMRVIFNEPQE